MTAPVLFRWSLWNPSTESIAMLDHSIGTFRHFFGAEADYLVYTDSPDLLASQMRVSAQLARLDVPAAEYDDARATWKKWAPQFRHDPTVTEIRVDADIFLLSEPTEILEFIEGDGSDYLVTQEEYVELWPYGNFGNRLPDGFAPINAGLLGQRADCDLSTEVRAAYQWWSQHVTAHEVKYHDEQGAVAWVLQPHIEMGKVRLLDPARYRVVCPTNATPVESIDGLAAMHATYPEHPAFYRFLNEISQISGIAIAPDQPVPAEPTACGA